MQDFAAEVDIDIALVHIAAAQHATVLAQWLPKLLLHSVKPPTAVPCESDATGQLSPAKLQPQPGTTKALVVQGSGAMSTNSSTIAALYDVQNASTSADLLSRMTSMQTAASLTPAPSGTGKPPKHAIHRIMRQAKVSMRSFSASCAIGGRDTLSFQCDAWVTDAGESCQIQHLTVFMNGCTLVEVLDVGARINVTQEEVTGGDDLKAEVRLVPCFRTGAVLKVMVFHSSAVCIFLCCFYSAPSYLVRVYCVTCAHWIVAPNTPCSCALLFVGAMCCHRPFDGGACPCR